MTSVNRKGLVVAGFGQLHMSLRPVDVAQMPNRVSKPEIAAFGAIDRNRLFIMLPRGIHVA